MLQRILMWLVLFLTQFAIAILAAIGTLTLLCLWKAELMFLAWDYPVRTIAILAAVLSSILALADYGMNRVWLLGFIPKETGGCSCPPTRQK